MDQMGPVDGLFATQCIHSYFPEMSECPTWSSRMHCFFKNATKFICCAHACRPSVKTLVVLMRLWEYQGEDIVWKEKRVKTEPLETLRLLEEDQWRLMKPNAKLSLNPLSHRVVNIKWHTWWLRREGSCYLLNSRLLELRSNTSLEAGGK